MEDITNSDSSGRNQTKTDLRHDLTEGGIFTKLLFISVPIMGTNMMQLAYNLTDMFWLGRVGSGAVAAAGAAGMYMWLSMGFMLIGRMGAEIGVAQCMGRGDKKTALAYSQNAAFIALILGVLFGVAAVFFHGPLIGFYNFSEREVAGAAQDYLSIVGIAMPLTFLTSIIAGTYNASGNSRTPFLINSLGLGLNITLDPLFIFVFGMGLKGAAIATVIGQAIVFAVMFRTFLFSKNRPFARYFHMFRIERKKLIQLLKWSLPIGIENIMFSFLSMVTSRVAVSFGAAAMAVNRVGSQIEALSWLIGGGYGAALIVFVGQNYGAKKQERIRQGIRVSFLAMTIWGVLVTVFLFTLGGAVFAIFLPDPDIIPLGKAYLFILAFCQLPMNLEAVGSGGFKGTGRTIPPSLASIITNVIRPVLAWILSRGALGVYGVWVAVSITAVMRGLWICGWYLATSGYLGKKRGEFAQC